MCPPTVAPLIVGLVKVLFVRVCVPVRVATVESISIVMVLPLSSYVLSSPIPATIAVLTASCAASVRSAEASLLFNCVWIEEVTPSRYPISVSVTFATLSCVTSGSTVNLPVSTFKPPLAVISTSIVIVFAPSLYVLVIPSPPTSAESIAS